MQSEASRTALLQYSTDAHSARERASFWREEFGRQIAKADFELLSDDAFAAEATLLALPGLQVAWCRCDSPALWLRTPQLVQNEADALKLLLPRKGRVTRSQRGRELEVRVGEAAITFQAEPSSIRAARLDDIVVIVPRAALLPLARDIDQASTRVVRPAGGILGLLRAYVTSLRKSADAADPSLGPLAAVHVCELVAMAIGTTRDGEQAALAGGVRAARMQAIKADFAGNPALTLAAIAARHKVTPRYVQLLFEAEGTTFTAYALEQRLGDAWRRLTSPRYEHWTIARIALEAGFGDLSHFNRAFRRRYRVAPSEARAEAANSGALANTR